MRSQAKLFYEGSLKSAAKNEDIHMQGYSWSPSEKKAARAAFEQALAREMKAIKEEAVAMVKNMQDDFAIWDSLDYLSKKRRRN